MGIRKMLFVTEFEELWFDALQSLMDLRKAGLNHVVFLHVIDRDEVAMHRGKGYLKDEEIKLKEIANVRFIDWAESLFEQGMEAGAHIVVGKFIPKTIDIAEDEGVDLIVTGYHKQGRVQELYAGSQIMEIIRSTSKPVMVHKYMLDSGKINEHPFEKPLLAVDWSPASKKAVKFIAGLKNVVKEVQVVHVASEKSVKGDSAMDVQKIRKESRQKMEEMCAILRAEGIKAEEHLYIGNTVEQIEKAAHERQATMIVAGTSGRESLKEKFLGSVPRQLAEKSVYPTLFVPPDE
ncbi:MAG: universal stress protein family protein [Spirochaetes bacterium RBG_13_51_14]|nr:MAG: universal stress protein family protein [Spirochaetes bacterium RBG_13_51_14]